MGLHILDTLYPVRLQLKHSRSTSMFLFVQPKIFESKGVLVPTSKDSNQLGSESGGNRIDLILTKSTISVVNPVTYLKEKE